METGGELPSFSCSGCEVKVPYPYNLRKHEESEHGEASCSSSQMENETLELSKSAKHNSKLLSNTSSNGGGLMTDQMINNGENKISAQTRLQSKGITSKTMLAIETERLQTKQNGRQYTSHKTKQKDWYG